MPVIRTWIVRRTTEIVVQAISASDALEKAQANDAQAVVIEVIATVRTVRT